MIGARRLPTRKASGLRSRSDARQLCNGRADQVGVEHARAGFGWGGFVRQHHLRLWFLSWGVACRTHVPPPRPTDHDSVGLQGRKRREKQEVCFRPEAVIPRNSVILS
jgi:hypothetical protein